MDRDRCIDEIPPGAASPYRIPPASPWFHVLNVSGGRSSGFMLRKVLDAHGGALPPRCEAVFANTGRERPETLDFVAALTEQWGVPVTWLEFDYRPDREPGSGRTKYRARVVSRETASLDGEPFDALLDSGAWLPSMTARIGESFEALRDAALAPGGIEAIGRPTAGEPEQASLPCFCTD